VAERGPGRLLVDPDSDAGAWRSCWRARRCRGAC